MADEDDNTKIDEKWVCWRQFSHNLLRNLAIEMTIALILT